MLLIIHGVILLLNFNSTSSSGIDLIASTRYLELNAISKSIPSFFY